jgi:hypothetical protein
MCEKTSEAIGQILGQEPPILGLALLGGVSAQIVIAAVDGDDSSARRFVMAEGRNADGAGHGGSGLNPVITGL